MGAQTNEQPTTQDILEAINTFADHVYERFNKIEGRLTKVEATMVTKDYLDDKLADLRGDLVVSMRKEDNKLKALINILHQKNVLSVEDKQQIFALEPFAQI